MTFAHQGFKDGRADAVLIELVLLRGSILLDLFMFDDDFGGYFFLRVFARAETNCDLAELTLGAVRSELTT